MSWYSPIYIWVREYRRQKPFIGFIFAKLMNTLLILQLLGLFYSYYVYVFVVCGYYLCSPLQATFYICIYSSLSIMAIWCLATTIFTSVARVPRNYAISELIDAQLKRCTPKENGRYTVDKSTPEQTAQQNQILTSTSTQLGITQAECDQAGRNKYCYICCHLKPDRAHHCSSCGECVVKFDHHCPWINHCINYSNYKSFLLYIFYTTITIVWFLFTSLECIIRYFINKKYNEELNLLLQLLIAMVPFAIFGYYPLGEMIIFHFGLLSINETTCEQAKPAVLKYDFKADYNQGRMKNFKQVFGWGLWLFPLHTTLEDGLHYEIRYVDEDNPFRFNRVEVNDLTKTNLMENNCRNSGRKYFKTINQC